MTTNTNAGEGHPAGVQILTDDTFIAEVLQADTPVLVDFWATWCGPCKMMAPIFARLAPEYAGRVKFGKLDVDENPGIAGALRIESIPTFMLFYRNVVLNTGIGAVPAVHLREWIGEGLARMKDVTPDMLAPADAEDAAEATPPAADGA